MKKLIILVICFLGIANLAYAGAAATCGRQDILDAISATAEGGTVTVPAGTCSWNSGVVITKGINLVGSGSSTTIINSNLSSTEDFMVSYSPVTPSNNTPFVLTGFRFNASDKSMLLSLSNSSHTTPLTKVRVHNNIFTSSICQSGNSVLFNITGGSVFGVFDNNTVSGYWIVHTDSQQRDNWDDTVFTYGTANNFYFEDNTITGGACPNNPATGIMTGSGWGGRYASRYNSFIYTGTGGLFPWYDIHGNQGSGVYAPMGVEIYGNSFSSTTFYTSNSLEMFHHRGGAAVIFINYATTTNTVFPIFQLNEEYADNISLTDHASGLFSGSSANQPQHISDSYYWNNRYKTTIVNPTLDIECCAGTGGYGPDSDCCYNAGGTQGIKANTDYWYQGASFDGSSGVGTGTLANRPATCTTGVGYWSTSQSVTDLTGLVGANPTTPINGILYKCTSTNTWTSFYTPYTYPHPLRVSTPGIAGGVSITGGSLQ